MVTISPPVHHAHASTTYPHPCGGRGKVGMRRARILVISSSWRHPASSFLQRRGKVYVKRSTIPAAALNARAGHRELRASSRVRNRRITRSSKEGADLVVTLTKRGTIRSEVTDREFREGDHRREDRGRDQLLGAAITDGTRDIIIATHQGMSIRFDEKQVRPMGRSTVGVKAIDLSEGDHVVGLGVTSDGDPQVLAVCEKGFGKRTPLEEFRPQNRGGKGIILIDASERNGPVVGIALVKPETEACSSTDRGQTLRTKVSEIRETGRNAQGVRVMDGGSRGSAWWPSKHCGVGRRGKRYRWFRTADRSRLPTARPATTSKIERWGVVFSLAARCFLPLIVPHPGCASMSASARATDRRRNTVTYPSISCGVEIARTVSNGGRPLESHRDEGYLLTATNGRVHMGERHGCL